MTDVWTVMWKEWKEILHWGGSRGKLAIFILVGTFGIYLPWLMGRAWVESPVSLVSWTWVPLFLVNSVIADTFAGERERHTLETLLASRLSDQAILFGKIGAALTYGLGITWLSLLLGLVVVNLVHGQGKLLLYSLPVGLGIAVLSLLGACLAASAGTLVSLRAATTRQVQQTLNIAMMVLLFVPIFGVQVLPGEWKARLVAAFTAADVTRLVVIVAIVLAVLDAGLLAAAMARFRRAQLILPLMLFSLLALSACSARSELQTPTAGPQASPTQPAKATQPPDAEAQPVPTREEKTATAPVSTPVRPTAAPSPTAVPTGAGGQGGAAQATVEAFLQAVESGDIEQALSYWNLNRPDQPIGYARSIRQLVNQWAADQRRFHIQETSYHGFVGPRDWRRLDESDPRVEGALVQVAVDGLRGAFDLDKTSGAWRICGWMQPGDQVAAPG